MREFFEDLKERTPWPFVVLMDNARIHVSRANMAWYEENEITVIRNMPYRPDLMGIESYWRLVKLEYRACVVGFLVAREDWNQSLLINQLLREVDPEKVKNCAE